MENNKVSKQYVSVAEAAKILGYSRQHVLRLVNAGEIKAQKVGRNFVIERENLPGPFSNMTKAEEKEIDKAVTKIFKEYGEAIKKLGKE